MELEQQVTSLELSKRMKELGFKQDSLFYWVKGEMVYGYEGEWSIKESDKWFIFDHIVGIKFDKYNFDVDAGDMGSSDEEYLKWEKRQNKLKKEIMKHICPAYTVAELGILLPKEIKSCRKKWFISCQWNRNGNVNIAYLNEEVGAKLFEAVEKTEADARAKMLIYLKENKLI